MDLVSIIVPVYNVSKYLEECVNSLINQTYSNIEILLVNDGSTDNSGEICETLKSRDQRIKVIHKKNEGLGFARNTGLNYIKGKYVTFIDSDDYADIDLIQKLYSAIIEKGADTCIGGFKRVDNKGNILYKEIYRETTYINEDIVNSLLSRMFGSSPEKSDSIRMSVWNVLYSTKIIKNNKIMFPSERIYISEDIIFDIEYYRHAQKCIIIDSCAYNYRVNNESLTRKYNSDRFEKNKFLYNEIYKKIKEYKLNESCIHRLQRQYFVNIKSSIRQENVKISNLSLYEAIRNIKNICSDKQLQSIIENYPIKKMGIKQRLFLYMVNKNMAKLLYLSILFNLL